LFPELVDDKANAAGLAVELRNVALSVFTHVPRICFRLGERSFRSNLCGIYFVGVPLSFSHDLFRLGSRLRKEALYLVTRLSSQNFGSAVSGDQDLTDRLLYRFRLARSLRLQPTARPVEKRSEL
jgi:hypothetical protein